MSEEPADGAAVTSPFATKGPPSSALIEKVLRALPADPDVRLDEHTVEPLCRRLRESARLLADFSLTDHPADRAESFRYLLKMVTYAVDAGLLNSDPLEPMFSAPYRLHFLDWGGASPDGVYRRAVLRDDLAYRVYGRIGNADYLSMDLRQSSPQVTITPDQLALDAEGNFELFLGGAPRDEQWWPLHPGTVGIVVREFFGDWIAAQRSHLRVECLDGATAPRPEYRADRVAEEYDVIGDWVLEGAVRYWIKVSEALTASIRNSFRTDLHRTETKLPVLTFGWFDLEPDEGLLIELPDPDAPFWGMHLTTAYWSTIDYANRLTTCNLAQATPDPDGIFRIVVSARDPGVYNWLDTTGLHEGLIILRFCGARSPVPPTASLVKLAELGERLPDARRCRPDERRAQIAERREGVSHMVCD